MTAVCADALVLASRLLQYPGRTYIDDVRAFAERFSEVAPDSRPALQAFVDRTSGRSVEDLQEMFTQTFDMTPACALEVGWHLFGEDYARGAFLARMRAALRAHEVDEGTELPDHLASLLSLVTRLEADEADMLVTQALLPAIDKMLDSLEKIGSPFEPPFRAIREVLATGTSAVEVLHA